MRELPQRLIDRALLLASTHAAADSPRARELLATLAGRHIALELPGLPWALVLESTGSALRTRRLGPDERADAHIHGTALGLMALLQQEGTAPSAAGLRIEGDARVAEQFRELTRLLRPDLEHGLSRVVGRSGAHLMMRGARAAADWSRASAWTAVQNIAEYLAHESGDLVSRAEAQHFLRGVDELREQLDRIEARLSLAAQRTHQLAGGPESV